MEQLLTRNEVVQSSVADSLPSSAIHEDLALDAVTPHRLIQMLMEGALDKMEEAKQAMECNDIPRKGVVIGKAVDIIDELRSSLNPEVGGEFSQNMAVLYAYMEKRLVEGHALNEPAYIDEVMGLLSMVKSGWDEISDLAEEEAAVTVLTPA